MSKRPNSSRYFWATSERRADFGEASACMVVAHNHTRWSTAVYYTRKFGDWTKHPRPLHTECFHASGLTLREAMKNIRIECDCAGIDQDIVHRCIRSIWAQRRQPSGKALADREARVR